MRSQTRKTKTKEARPEPRGHAGGESNEEAVVATGYKVDTTPSAAPPVAGVAASALRASLSPPPPASVCLLAMYAANSYWFDTSMLILTTGRSIDGQQPSTWTAMRFTILHGLSTRIKQRPSSS
jgi:hypothetical protein